MWVRRTRPVKYLTRRLIQRLTTPVPASQVPQQPHLPPPPAWLRGCTRQKGTPTGVMAFLVPTVDANLRGKKCNLDLGKKVLIIAESSSDWSVEVLMPCGSSTSSYLSVSAPSTKNLVSSAAYLVEVGCGRKSWWKIVFACCGGVPKIWGRPMMSTFCCISNSQIPMMCN